MKNICSTVVCLAALGLLGCRPDLGLEGSFQLDPSEVHVEIKEPGTEAYRQEKERILQILEEENQVREIIIRGRDVSIRFDDGTNYDAKLEVLKDEDGRIFSYLQVGDKGRLTLSLVKLSSDSFALDGIIYRKRSEEN